MGDLTAETLVAGPRGRRFLLHYTLESAEQLGWDHVAVLREAVSTAADDLDPEGGGGSSRYMLTEASVGDDFPAEFKRRKWRFAPLPRKQSRQVLQQQNISAAELTEVVELLAEVPLKEPTPEFLRLTLTYAVSVARYWQPPDGQDELTNQQALRPVLQSIAEHVLSTPVLASWSSPLQPADQYVVHFQVDPPIESVQPPQDMAAALEAWRRDQEDQRQRFSKRKYQDIHYSISGEWWSFPSTGLMHTTSSFTDGSGALGMWWCEDDMGWEQAKTQHVDIRDSHDARPVLEVSSPEVWANLCAKFPLDVTAQKRHDWYRTTWRDGDWVIPDWSQVAQHYRAVHLSLGAYLQGAGKTIPVGENTASVIAGWNPDQTYWFTNSIQPSGAPHSWKMNDDGGWFPS